MNFIVYFFAFFKNVIYGLTVFFTGSLLDSTDIMDILALRFLMSAVTMMILKTVRILKINVGIKDFFVKSKHSLYIRQLLLAAFFEPILNLTFETLGVAMTTGVTAGVILSLTPISSCVAEGIFLKEKTTKLQKTFLGLGIIGAIYISVNTDTTTGENTLSGMLFLLLAVITGSLFETFTRKCSVAFTAMERTYISAVLGAFTFNIINIVRHIYNDNIIDYFKPYYNFKNIIGFIFLSIVSTVIATGMGNFALSRMQVSTMSAFSGVSTIVTVAVGALIGKERLEIFHIIGLTLIIIRMIGISFISIKHNSMNYN